MTITIEDLRADWSDWVYGFECAARDCIESVPPGTTLRTDPFLVTDVAEIAAAVAGENDESDWVGVFRLHDGRWIAIAAGCDYSGWG